uniref:Sorting nexin 4 n=1 Tax=Leptobrachium leishanense TaxID=445787 RepID=A0A8C5WBX4_9ANUR
GFTTQTPIDLYACALTLSPPGRHGVSWQPGTGSCRDTGNRTGNGCHSTGRRRYPAGDRYLDDGSRRRRSGERGGAESGHRGEGSLRITPCPGLYLPVTPCPGLYLPVTPCPGLYLPVTPCPGLYLPITPCPGLYLPITPCPGLYLPVTPCPGLYLPITPCPGLYLPITPCPGLYLPITPCPGLYLPVTPCPGLYLPITPCPGLYLPITPCPGLYLPVTPCPGLYLPVTPCPGLYLPVTPCRDYISLLHPARDYTSLLHPARDYISLLHPARIIPPCYTPPGIILPITPCPGLYLPVTPCPGLYLPVTPRPGLYLLITPCPGLYLPVTPRPGLYLPITPCPGLYLPVTPCPGLYLPITPCPGLYLPVTPCPGLYLPVTPCPGLYLPVTPCPGLYLPVTPCPGLYLPVTPCPGLYLPVTPCPGLYLPVTPCPGLYLPVTPYPGLYLPYCALARIIPPVLRPGPDYTSRIAPWPGLYLPYCALARIIPPVLRPGPDYTSRIAPWPGLYLPYSALAGVYCAVALYRGCCFSFQSDEDSLLMKLEISVSEAEKRTGKNAVNMQETYTAYLIETRSLEPPAEGQSSPLDALWRRYSEFELLRGYLSVSYPFMVVPPLPEKRAEFVWHKLSADNMDPDFVERRRIGLENFLMRVASHPVLCHDELFHAFLTQTDSRLKALNATFRVRNPDKRFTELKHYSDELQSVISHLLRVRARVADRLYGVYKVHGNYGRVFSEWSAIEKEMGDGLQSAGHHMDVYASSIDDILEEEEHYADQLKEYLFYAEALRAVCRKHELMQYDLEMSALDLASKKQQSEELATGTVRTFSLKGVTSKLFGQETPEQREAKLKLLEEQIEEGEEQLKVRNVESREFVKNAWLEIERFKEQKNRDLKEALISYAVMQISMCKKGIQVWTNAKECFSKM